jgi:two-component system NtrC family sensor kinase
VYVDPDQVTQVFINLLLNAIQSMEIGGKISIKIYLDPEYFITIKITDTGGGIKEADIHNIFEPFFTTKTDGTGLGLTISKNILMQNDIDISVESQLGAGTTFTLAAKVHHEI